MHREPHKVASQLLLCLAYAWALVACVTLRPALAPIPWSQRVIALQNNPSWDLSGRVAVAVGTQGWQATLDWQQRAGLSELHLAGPLGLHAVNLKNTPAGLSIDGAPPSDLGVTQLQQRLGFELPLEHLKFWLLGVPDPAATFEISMNAVDRVEHLTQADWTMDYDRYLSLQGDWLPAHLVLQHAGVRVRISVDHWILAP